MPAWTPPQQLQVVTAPIYAFLRMGIEAGNEAVLAYAKARDGGCKPIAEGGEGCWIDPSPTTATLAEIYYQYVPAQVIPLQPAQEFAKLYLGGADEYMPTSDADRLGWPTFVDRKALVKALDDVTPASVKTQIGNLNRPPDLNGTMKDLPSANTDDPSLNLQWWMVAFGSGGALAWLGQSKALATLAVLSPASKVKALITIAAGFVLFAAATGATAAVLPWVKQTAETIVIEPLAKTTNILGIALGVGGAALVAFLVYKIVVENKPTKREPRGIAA